MQFTVRTAMLITLMSSISLALYATQQDGPGVLDISQDEIEVPNNSFAGELTGSLLSHETSSTNQSPLENSEKYRTSNSPSSPNKKKYHFGIIFPNQKEIEFFLRDGNYTNFNSNYGILNLTHRGSNYQKFLTLINRIVKKELEVFAPTSPGKKHEKTNIKILIHKMITFNKVIALVKYLLSCDVIHSTLFCSKEIDSLQKSHFTKNELQTLRDLERQMIQ